MELEEALRLSLLPPEEREEGVEEEEEEGGKRKLEDRGQTPQAKRRRLDPTEEEEDEEDEEEDEPVEDVYKPGGEEGWTVKHPQFPSILELLDIDIPVVESLVKDRYSPGF